MRPDSTAADTSALPTVATITQTTFDPGPMLMCGCAACAAARGETSKLQAVALDPPTHDPALLVEDTLEIPVQINGKLRDRITIPASSTTQQIEAAALACEKIKPFMEGKAVKKVIVVPKKLVNIVVS